MFVFVLVLGLGLLSQLPVDVHIRNTFGEFRTVRNPHGSVPVGELVIRLTNVMRSPNPACCQTPTGLHAIVRPR